MSEQKANIGRALESYLETLKQSREPEESAPPTIPVTTRLETHIVFIIDKLAAQVGESRSAFMQRVLCDSAFEFAEHLGKWEEWNVEFAKLGLEGGKKALKEAA